VVQFARDVDLLRAIAGEVNQLGAMGSPGVTAEGDPLAYNNLAVQMAGEQGRIVRWTIGHRHELTGGRLTISGGRASATLIMPHEETHWRLAITTGGESTNFQIDDWNPCEASLDELRAALDAEQSSRWLDAARAVELAETIDRSLAKGRIIDLHEQEYSDASTFKGMMTSVGCALLMGSLVIIVAAVLIENLLRHAGAARAAQLVGIVPYVVAGIFGIFLALQFFLKLAHSGERSASGKHGRDGGS
jgi:hypothetical protein